MVEKAKIELIEIVGKEKMIQELDTQGNIGFYNALTNQWYKIEFLDIRDGLFREINYSITTPDHLNSFMLPGFIDAHCHILENPYNEPKDVFDIAYYNSLVAINHGITSVRDLGGYGYKAIEISRLLSKFKLTRIYTSGCYYTVPEGHCFDRGAIEISNIEEFKESIKILLYNKIKYCKILNDDQGFDFSLLCQMIEFAHHNGMLVSTHAYTEKAAYDAVMAGTDTLEHAGDYSNELLNLIKERDVIVIPTYIAAVDSTVENCKELSDVDKDVLLEWLRGENLVIPKLFTKNIRVGLGTDAGFLGTPFDSLFREIDLLHNRFGITIPKLLYSANIITPMALAEEDNIGRIEKGYKADFLIYNKNPLNEIEILKSPAQIWLNGEKVGGNNINIGSSLLQEQRKTTRTPNLPPFEKQAML